MDFCMAIQLLSELNYRIVRYLSLTKDLIKVLHQSAKTLQAFLSPSAVKKKKEKKKAVILNTAVSICSTAPWKPCINSCVESHR